MSQSVTSPVLPWTPERLQELDSDELDGLARGAGRSLVVGRLLIGRCMLEMDRRDLACQWGLSGSVHYAVRALRISRKVARDARRVADALRALPVLTRAAEAGDLGWAHLREAVRVATPETEQAWLDATELPWPRFWRLVKAADPGDLPGEGQAAGGGERRGAAPERGSRAGDPGPARGVGPARARVRRLQISIGVAVVVDRQIGVASCAFEGRAKQWARP